MKKYLLIILVAMVGFSALGQKFVFVFLNNKPDRTELPKDEVDKIMEGHMANINRLAKEGKLIAAGPFEGGGGIFIFNSGSKKEVETWLETDPGVQAKRWDIETFDYTPRTGSVCKADEPIEMTSYQFVRFVINASKHSMSDKAAEAIGHEQYLQQLGSHVDIIQQGTFGPDQGGIIVIRGDLNRESIEKDPAVQRGFMQYDLKKLYIAKGSFCEK